MIVSGEFEPGTRLNEVELAHRLGISRGPVREAIQRLAAEGLVKVVPNLGSFVVSFTESELVQLYEFRTIVEAAAARLAAERATDEQLASLRALLDRTGRKLKKTATGAYPEDVDFHRGIFELAGNAPLLRAGNDLEMQVRIARLRSGRSPERARVAIDEHVEIVTAIVSRDPDAASAAMSRHLENSLKNVLELLRAQPAAQPARGGLIR
jgi:DNA-binding GntR family transcriptional regulator